MDTLKVRANPTDEDYARARSLVVGWLDGDLPKSALAAIPSDEAALLVDKIAWALTEHGDRAREEVARGHGWYVLAARLRARVTALEERERQFVVALDRLGYHAPVKPECGKCEPLLAPPPATEVGR
jgi:hypothetical protein